jgi:hypothetical protein
LAPDPEEALKMQTQQQDRRKESRDLVAQSIDGNWLEVHSSTPSLRSLLTSLGTQRKRKQMSMKSMILTGWTLRLNSWLGEYARIKMEKEDELAREEGKEEVERRALP